MPLLTIRLPRDATLASALRTLGLTDRDVDTGFGLVPVDPDAGLFALRVTDAAAARVTAATDEAQIFADPHIETDGAGPHTGSPTC